MFKLLNTDFKAYTFIAVLSGLIFIPFIGNMPLFDWDEINFAECAREMVVSNNYNDVQLYFQPFWEKPPLFIWMQALSMNVFGINEFAARLPNALCGIATLLVLFRIGKLVNDQRFGLTWVFVYASTLLPHLFFKSGIIDPWFNLFIFLSVFNLIRHTNNPVGKTGFITAMLAGFFLGLALITKGPAALILVGLTVAIFFIYNRFRNISTFKFLMTFLFSFLLTGLSWFIVELVKGNGHVINEFIDYQIRLFKTEDSDHGGPFIYHFVVLLLGCFPSSVFFILALKKQQTDTPFQKHFKSWMLILFWVVLILFSIVQTKIVHYSSLCYFPLTYLATYSISKLRLKALQWHRYAHWLMITLTMILGILFVVIGLFPYLKNIIINSQLIDDEFAVENLKASVYWNGFEWLIGVFFITISLISIFKIKQKKFQFIYSLFFGSLLTVYAFIMIIAPKIERYSQHASIEFYKMCAQHHYEVESIGFKSYATLFYAQFKQSSKTHPALLDYIKSKHAEYKEKGIDPRVSFGYIYTNFLIEGKIDKSVCLVSKINELETITQNHPNLKLLYKENGFCFFIRKKDDQIK
jgi:4-amino-4-deoxy-L-arabinose transferase-like glycosyltransferase